MSGSAVLVDYQLPHVPLLSKQEMSELSRRIAEGDQEAKNRVIEANMRLVIEIAKKYRCDHLDAEDLVQEGILGLMRAVEKFDPTRGYAFSTVATLWIQRSIIRAIDNFDRPIRLPEHLMVHVRVIHKASSRLQMELQRMPTEDELVQHTGKPANIVRLVKSAPRIALSLDAPVDVFNDYAETYGDFVEDPDSNIEENYIDQMNDEQDLLHKTVETVLTGRQKDIFMLYYGIGCNEHGLRQLSVRFGITWQRVQQIAVKAERKVKRALRETLAKQCIGHRQERAS